ncbi:histidine phosphatase family protein [uncultured Ruegeria sp.]|uniref:SixA phosphatase family protein n=1 Tax=uncultured Ruegeria sp. TaxID=259304 RepID=UPI00261AE04E|nr:histidine phosphatase family protein [uncultured Ruegeria sp.]
MSRLLILMRHAKSSWGDLTLSDHDRPLNRRGRGSAPAMATWLQRQGWMPDEVISSTAIRTRETWQSMGMTASTMRFLPTLYLAGPDTMLAHLSEASGGSVLMLGHNPGIAEFANRIVAHAPDHDQFLDYPTCATTVIQFDHEDWSDVKWRSGKVLGFAIPREVLE